MFCCLVFLFSPYYLLNTEELIRSWHVTTGSTLCLIHLIHECYLPCQEIIKRGRFLENYCSHIYLLFYE